MGTHYNEYPSMGGFGRFARDARMARDAHRGPEGHHSRGHDHDDNTQGRGFGGRGFGAGPFGMAGFGGPGFGPAFGGRGGFGGRGPRRARKGDVRLAILSLLADEPANGYGLIKSIAEKTEGAWKPSPGSVYPTLQQLVDEGLVVESGEGRQSRFDLTDEGRAYVAAHTDEIARAWDISDGQKPGDDEFIASFLKLGSVVKQFHFDATDAQRKQAVDKLDELRRSLYTILAE